MTEAVAPRPFAHRAGGHCATSALRDLLEYHELSWDEEPLSEGMVFGLAGGLHFAYAESVDFTPPLWVVGRSEDLEARLCEHLEIPVEPRQTDDPELAERWLEEELRAGRPTMVWADLHALTYTDVRMHNTKHCVVVVDRDLAEGTAQLADHDFDELQSCTLADLARARNATAFPLPNRHMTWVMRFPERLPEPDVAVARGIARAVRNMREDCAPEDLPYRVGLPAVEEFGESWAGWPKRFGERLADALNGLRVFIIKAGADGTMFRSLQTTFLREASVLLGDDELREIAGLYAELGDEWAALGSAVASGDPAAAHARAAGRVMRIADLERTATDALADWLDGRDA